MSPEAGAQGINGEIVCGWVSAMVPRSLGCSHRWLQLQTGVDRISSANGASMYRKVGWNREDYRA
ncbi:MAG: hypothetical protein EBU40_02280 [Proteobacteria bacterium]|nr:hypothetical protein [Pseudomonadota bacterium]